MSRHVVAFGPERIEIDLPEGVRAESFTPPTGLTPDRAEVALREALEQPRNYPPLRKAVVEGDRVAIALDAELETAAPILDVVSSVLEEAGVEPGSITVVESTEGVGVPGRKLATEYHDPADRDRLAYLATTSRETRVYLNRTLTDADVVLPIGGLRHDPLRGNRGPWCVLYPGMSDRIGEAAAGGTFDPLGASDEMGEDEAQEVGWLLGSHFQVGVVPGDGGPAEFVAGQADEVRKQGHEALVRHWGFRPAERGDLVIVGVGGPDEPAGWDEVVAGLATAARLVDRGGKIVALTRAQGEAGPALRRLASAEDGEGVRALRGREAEPDFVVASTLARVLAWADVYLLSRFDQDVVEDLGLIPLEKAAEAQRLASRAASCLIVGRAELVMADVAGLAG